MNLRSLASTPGSPTRHPRWGGTTALVAVVLVLSAQAPVVGQAPSPTTKTPTAGKAWTPPRTPDGKPDLQGTWSNGTLTPFERPKGLGAKEFYTDQEYAELMKRVRQGEVGEEGDLGAARDNVLRYDLSLYGFDLTKSKFASNRRTSLIVGPEGVVPPMLPEAIKRNADRAAKNKGHEFDSYENRPLQERCILMGQERLPMVPGVNDNNLLQITQAPGWVAMLHEQNHHTRVIPTDGRPHISQNIRQWQGDSVGRWEGNTLVVDTTNFTGRDGQFQRIRGEAASRGTFHARQRRHAHVPVHRRGSHHVGQALDRGDPDDEDAGSGLRVGLPRGEQHDCEHPPGARVAEEEAARKTSEVRWTRAK